MAKPITWAPPMIAVFIPTTRPEVSASGPPELPGLIAASVWMTFSMRRPLSPLMERPSALTTPAVTLRWKPKGLPMATTSWPTTRFPASPSVAGLGCPPAAPAVPKPDRDDRRLEPLGHLPDRARIRVESVLLRPGARGEVFEDIHGLFLPHHLRKRPGRMVRFCGCEGFISMDLVLPDIIFSW